MSVAFLDVFWVITVVDGPFEMASSYLGGFFVASGMHGEALAGVMPRAKAWRSCACNTHTPTHTQGRRNPAPAPTSTPTNRPLPRDFVSPYCTVPCRHFTCSRMRPKSATSLNHPNRLNSPGHAIYRSESAQHSFMYQSPFTPHIQDKGCLASHAQDSVVEIEIDIEIEIETGHGLARPRWIGLLFHWWNYSPPPFSLPLITFSQPCCSCSLTYTLG